MNKTIVTIYGKPQVDLLNHTAATSSIQDEGLYGMPVTILERCSKGWVRIRTHYDYEGYVPLADLWLMTEEEKKQRTCDKLRFILQAYADVLSLPKVQGIRLQTLTRGAVITLVEEAEERGGWAKIRLNNGREGYIKSGFLGTYYEQPSSMNEGELRMRLVDSARSYLGTQYRWGGKSPLGIDCSGLCSMAYLLNGIKIFRDAKIKEGFPVHEIAFRDKKPGDLIFYKGHVVLYIGSDQYIHATAHNGSDGVVINSFNQKELHYRRDLAENIEAVGSIF